MAKPVGKVKPGPLAIVDRMAERQIRKENMKKKLRALLGMKKK